MNIMKKLTDIKNCVKSKEFVEGFKEVFKDKDNKLFFIYILVATLIVVGTMIYHHIVKDIYLTAMILCGIIELLFFISYILNIHYLSRLSSLKSKLEISNYMVDKKEKNYETIIKALVRIIIEQGDCDFTFEDEIGQRFLKRVLELAE